MKYILKSLLWIIIVALALSYFLLTIGLVLFKFYYWFALPVFTNLPHITYLQCVGLVVFLGVLKGNYTSELKEEYYKYTAKEKLAGLLVAPWIGLFVGWIIHNII